VVGIVVVVDDDHDEDNGSDHAYDHGVLP